MLNLLMYTIIGGSYTGLAEWSYTVWTDQFSQGKIEFYFYKEQVMFY